MGWGEGNGIGERDGMGERDGRGERGGMGWGRGMGWGQRVVGKVKDGGSAWGGWEMWSKGNGGGGGGGKVLGEDKKTGGCEGRQRFTQSSGWEKAAGVWGSSAGFAEHEMKLWGGRGGGCRFGTPPGVDFPPPPQ